MELGATHVGHRGGLSEGTLLESEGKGGPGMREVISARCVGRSLLRVGWREECPDGVG